jgi:hypothetical protein
MGDPLRYGVIPEYRDPSTFSHRSNSAASQHPYQTRAWGSTPNFSLSILVQTFTISEETSNKHLK